MKINNILILIISLIFILSIGASFAADENMTDLAVEDNDELQQPVDEVIEAPAEDDAQETVSTIKMNGVVSRPNGGVWYSATFYNASGSPLANQNVWFSIDGGNGYGYPLETDSNGVAILKVGVSKGNHIVTAVNFVTGFNSSASFKVFDVITGGKNIKMYYDDGNYYKVRVYDNNGNPLKAGQKVTFALDAKKYTVKTDKNGYAKLKITAKPGVHYVGATYNDFVVYNKITVKDIIYVKTGSLGYGLSKTTKVKVKYLGKKKKNKKLKVKFNKKTYKAKTNKKGIAVFKLKTPKKLGAYKLVVSYKKLKYSYLYTQYRVRSS